MLEFYLQDNGTFTKQDILVAPVLTETFDETLDNANIVLKSTNISTLIKPDTKCRLVFVNGEQSNIISNLVVASDSIEVISHNPLTYQHTLQLTQNTRLLQKHLVRNSVFSQPRDLQKGHIKYYVGKTDETDNKETIKSFSLGYNEKICPIGASSFIYANLQCILCTSNANDKPTITDFSKFKVWDATNSQWVSITSNTNLKIAFQINYASGSSESVLYSFKGNTKVMNATDSNFTIKIPFTANNEITSITSAGIWAFNGDTYIGDIFILDKTLSGYTTVTSGGTCLNLRYYVETYYWSMFDVIDTLRKQYTLTNDKYTKSYLFEMPDSNTDLYKILNNTIAPQFTFTGATMYECLAEIFKYYDAIFTLDENNKLGIEYLNEFSQTAIQKNFISKAQSFKEDGFTTGYVSYFENAIVEEEVLAVCRNTQYGRNADNETFYLVLPHDIQSIIKAEMYMEYGNIGSNNPLYTVAFYWNNDYYLDITDYIVNSEIYGALEDSNTLPAVTPIGLNIRDCLVYNGNTIDLGKFYSVPAYSSYKTLLYLMVQALKTNLNTSAYLRSTNDSLDCKSDWYSKFKVRIKYRAKVDGRVRVENENAKYNGEMIVNQSSGAVDTNKMGLNMLGLSYKMGEPTLSMVQEITTWENRVRKGQILTYNNERYLANVVKYTFYNDKIVSTIEFVKNYNALSQRIQVDRQKRLSQISNELTIKSEDNYCEYLYFSSTQPTTAKDEIVIRYDYLYKSLFDNLEYGTLAFGGFNSYYKKGTILKQNLYIPITKYISGNALCFEMSYDSPINAGNQTEYTGDNVGFTRVSQYTDNNGWADVVSLHLYGSEAMDKLFKMARSTDAFASFPYLYTADNYYYSYMGQLEHLEFYKKPNEIFSLNYQLIHLPMPTNNGIDFIGNKLLNYNGLYSTNISGKYYVYYSTTEKYSPFDFKALSNTRVEAALTKNIYSPVNDYITITLTHTAISYISWALCNENGDVLFASNTPATNSTTEHIYILPKHTRLDDTSSIPQVPKIVATYFNNGSNETLTLKNNLNSNIIITKIAGTYLNDDTYSTTITPNSQNVFTQSTMITIPRPRTINVVVDYTYEGGNYQQFFSCVNTYWL